MKPSLKEAKESLQANLEFTRQLTQRFPTGTGYTAAIRRKCLDCCVGDRAQVANCGITDCALWPFRFGSSPFKPARKSPTGTDPET